MREKIVRAVAGTMVLASAVLTLYVHTSWIWLAVFVGANLLQSSFTKFCPLEKVLDKIGVESSGSDCCKSFDK